MSWLISRALMQAYENSRYSLGLAAEYLAATSSDGAPSAQSSGSHIPHAYLPSDKMTAFSRLSRFGMTFAPLTDDRGEDLLTWFLAASRARTYPQPGKAQESTESDQASGVKWRELSVRYDRATSSWRTHRSLWDEDLSECSLTLPKWGLMRDGVLSERLTSGLPTRGTGCGLWPTPNCIGFRSDGELALLAKSARSHQEYLAMSHRAANSKRERYWPTPTVCGNYNRPGSSATSGMGLASAVKLWPTPTATLGTKGGRVTPRKSREGGTLIEAVSYRAFATPTARDWRSGKASQATMDRNSRPLSEQVGGSLNPTWVEWLMGWPLAWTDLKPLETAKFRSWLQRHGDC